MTVRAHSRSQKVLYSSLAPCEPCAGHAQAAPGSSGAGATSGSRAEPPELPDPLELRRLLLDLVDDFVVVDVFDEELEELFVVVDEEVVVSSSSSEVVVVGVGVAVVLVWGKSSTGSAMRASSSEPPQAESAGTAMSAAAMVASARLRFTGTDFLSDTSKNVSRLADRSEDNALSLVPPRFGCVGREQGCVVVRCRVWGSAPTRLGEDFGEGTGVDTRIWPLRMTALAF